MTPSPSRRSASVTVLGWLVIAAGALALPFGLLVAMMFIAPHYGSWSLGTFGSAVIFGPPLLLVAGIGLLCRKPWARLVLLLMAAALLLWSVLSLIPGRRPEADPVVLIAALIVAAIPLVVLLPESARNQFKTTPPASIPPADDSCGWRVGHRGRDMMYYEELVDGVWQRIDIDGGMLTGPAHHVIYFAAPRQWENHPEWARHRRDEIIARIKSRFREPGYIYQDGGGPTGPATPPILPSVPPRLPAAPATPGQILALVIYLAILTGIAGFAFSRVKSGLESGETRLPMKQSSHRRVVLRAREPSLFYLSIGVFSIAGLASSGLAAWCLKNALFQEKQRRS